MNSWGLKEDGESAEFVAVGVRFSSQERMHRVRCTEGEEESERLVTTDSTLNSLGLKEGGESAGLVPAYR